MVPWESVQVRYVLEDQWGDLLVELTMVLSIVWWIWVLIMLLGSGMKTVCMCVYKAILCFRLLQVRFPLSVVHGWSCCRKRYEYFAGEYSSELFGRCSECFRDNREFNYSCCRFCYSSNSIHCRTGHSLLCCTRPVTVLPSPLGGVFKIDGVVQAIPQFDPAALGIGNHFVEYTYTTNYGCTNSTLMNVRVTACLNTGSIDPENKLVFPVPARDRLIIADAGWNHLFRFVRKNFDIALYRWIGQDYIGYKRTFTWYLFCRIKKHGTTYIVKWIKE